MGLFSMGGGGILQKQMLKQLAPMGEQALNELMKMADDIAIEEGESQPAILLTKKNERPFFVVVILNAEGNGFTRAIRSGYIEDLIKEFTENQGK